MKRKKAVFIEVYDKDGNLIKQIPMTAADDDWIRAGRLRKRAQEGDQKAAEKLSEMESTQMYCYEDESDDELDSEPDE